MPLISFEVFSPPPVDVSLGYLGKYQKSCRARAVEIFFSNDCYVEYRGVFSL